MSPIGAARLKSWLRRTLKPQNSEPGQPLAESPPNPLVETTSEPPVPLDNPVENYYRHRLQTNLAVFNRFALQSRSIEIRDVFAKAASIYNVDLTDLLVVVQEQLTTDPDSRDLAQLVDAFDCDILLSLADLLANTAQDDLDILAAVRLYDFVEAIGGTAVFEISNKLQYIEALHDVAQYEQVAELVERFELDEIAPLQRELLQIERIRRAGSSDQERLNALNELYRSLGMTELELIKDTSLPFMDRLAGSTAEPIEGPKITVIMPTYSPDDGIRTAIRGLLDQSWQNLEIIVVNDASPEEYRPILDEIGASDPRVRVLHQEENLGAYVARNAGLAVSTGDFITTHDDDDWSHPDKIALQVAQLLEHPNLVATTSEHIRTTEDLAFRRVNVHAKYLQMNYSSLMFRRSVLDALGEWDTVNRGGDSEFYLRLLTYAGSEAVHNLQARPLSFSRVWDGSLTSGEMARGFFGYSRLMYRWSFRQSFWDAKREQRPLFRTSSEPRSYAIPTTFEAGERNADLGHFDVIYVADFFRQAKHVDFALQEIETLADNGFRVGYMHLYSPETNQATGFPRKLFDLQLAQHITQVAVEDSAETSLLVCVDPSVGMFADQLRSTVRTQQSIVVERELASLAGGKRRTAVDFRQAIKNLDRCFGTSFKGTGTTGEEHSRILNSLGAARVLDSSVLWRPHLQGDFKPVKIPATTPTVGFHSYGNQYRWPNNSDSLREVYVSPDHRTRFLGHLDKSLDKFDSTVLEDIELFEADEMSESEFLDSIDFWVYWPHHRLNDQLWLPVLSAMQAGKVVILPERLKDIYGDAALYAPRNQIQNLVAQLSNSPQRYIEQAHKGQAFVRDGFTKDHLISRTKKMLGEDPASY